MQMEREFADVNNSVNFDSFKRRHYLGEPDLIRGKPLKEDFALLEVRDSPGCPHEVPAILSEPTWPRTVNGLAIHSMLVSPSNSYVKT